MACLRPQSWSWWLQDKPEASWFFQIHQLENTVRQAISTDNGLSWSIILTQVSKAEKEKWFLFCCHFDPCPCQSKSLGEKRNRIFRQTKPMVNSRSNLRNQSTQVCTKRSDQNQNHPFNWTQRNQPPQGLWRGKFTTVLLGCSSSPRPCAPGWVGASQLPGARREVANLEIVCEGKVFWLLLWLLRISGPPYSFEGLSSLYAVSFLF